MAMGWYDLLDVPPGASTAEVRSGYKKQSLIYHPDKGGDKICFRYIKFVADALMDPQKRQAYDDDGRAAFEAELASGFGDAGDAPAPQVHMLPAPPVNVDFLHKLMCMSGAHQYRWGSCSLSNAIKKVLDSPQTVVNYRESDLAVKLGMELRLTYKGIPPVYSLPRLVRFAAFMGMDLTELDMPSSHGRQILKYALKHELPHEVLSTAFGKSEVRGRFRTLPEFSDLGLTAEHVKKVVNMICYGSSGASWVKDHHLVRLPATVKLLKSEVKGVVQHLARACSPEVKKVLQDRKDSWELTLLSIMCQEGERVELATCVSMLPEGAVLHGWLGDSVLLSGRFDAEQFCKSVEEAHDVLIGVKPFPASADQYYQLFQEITGSAFNQDVLSERELRRVEAKEYASKYLQELSLPKNEKSVMFFPVLEFAIAVEAVLPVTYNILTRKLEYYDTRHGKWFADGGGDMIRGEVLSDALRETFTPMRWGFTDENGRLKTRLLPQRWDDSCMRSPQFLSPISEMVRHLRFPTSDALDSGPNASRMVNFEGPFMLDFSIPKPQDVNWQDDAELETAMNLPLRKSLMSDRLSRSVPRCYEAFRNPIRFDAARAICMAMKSLKESDVLSEEAKTELSRVSEHMPMLKKIFHDAHLDWDSAFYQLRLVLEPCGNVPQRVQIATFMDDGEGSTCKGTLRELCDSCLGVFTGEGQLGYCAVIKQETIILKKGESPSEQLSNLFLCKHAWLDDFSTQKALNNAVLRSLCGGNNLTAARKHCKEQVFKFSGQFFLCSNGPWSAEERFVGADERRVTGLSFEIKFKDHPEGPNQLAKDSSIKAGIADFFSEFWWLAQAIWLAPQPCPKSDTTEPLCPNALLLKSAILKEAENSVKPSVEVVDAFLLAKMDEYIASATKPTSALEVDKAFVDWMAIAPRSLFVEEPKKWLSLRLFYKTGQTLPAVAGRKKTSVNCYMDADRTKIMTLKP